MATKRPPTKIQAVKGASATPYCKAVSRYSKPHEGKSVVAVGWVGAKRRRSGGKRRALPYQPLAPHLARPATFIQQTGVAQFAVFTQQTGGYQRRTLDLAPLVPAKCFSAGKPRAAQPPSPGRFKLSAAGELSFSGRWGRCVGRLSVNVLRGETKSTFQWR